MTGQRETGLGCGKQTPVLVRRTIREQQYKVLALKPAGLGYVPWVSTQPAWLSFLVQSGHNQ